MLVGVVYRSANSNSENNNKILNLIPEFIDYSHCLILGNFNLPTINWATLSSPYGEQSLSVTFVPVKMHF